MDSLAVYINHGKHNKIYFPAIQLKEPTAIAMPTGSHGKYSICYVRFKELLSSGSERYVNVHCYTGQHFFVTRRIIKHPNKAYWCDSISLKPVYKLPEATGRLQEVVDKLLSEPEDDAPVSNTR